MKHFLDKFPKENFYMIQFKIKEYNQNLSSFMLITVIQIFLQPFFWGGMLLVSNGVFKNIQQPSAYLLYYLISFMYVIQCIYSVSKKSQKKDGYELRLARNFYQGIMIFGIGFLLIGYLMLLDKNAYFVYQYLDKYQQIKFINILFCLEIITIFFSFLFMCIKIKVGYYKKNESKMTYIQFLNAASIALLPLLSGVIFITNLGMGDRSSMSDLFISIPMMAAGFLLAGASAYFYMIYYLRRRFPEDYLDDMKEENIDEN